MKTVAGKKILITGAAMGMGRMYAEKAVQEEADILILWDINQELLHSVAQELNAKGRTKVYSFCGDLLQLESTISLAKKIQQEFGGIDILINNAGIVRGKYFWEHDPINDIYSTMAVNAIAPMIITQVFLRDMMSRTDNECRILNIASAAGLFSNPRMSVYCSSKWACTGWSDSLRIELAQKEITHIRVTTVNPTYIATGMFAGVKSLPFAAIMDPNYATEQIWQAMKAGKPRLYMPRIIYLILALKGLLPLRWFDWMLNKLGVYQSMESFTGR